MIDARELQLRLATQGYPPPAIDGRIGRATYRALFDFAAGRSLDATGDALALSAVRNFALYGIVTALRIAHFLAQIVNETGGFRRFEEDLRYSAAALRATWPTRFTPERAARCEGDAAAIAEAAYGGRMGNSAPGDGWRYRGRGCLQLTGRANYAACGARLGIDLVGHPDLAADPAISLLIALEFWERGGVNAAADADDVVRARRITNGGAIGLDHVRALLARMKRVLA